MFKIVYKHLNRRGKKLGYSFIKVKNLFTGYLHRMQIVFFFSCWSRYDDETIIQD